MRTTESFLKSIKKPRYKKIKKYEVKDHAPGLLPDGYEFELV